MTARIIGVDIEDLRLPPKEAIRAASELLFRAVEVPAAHGDTSPENLSSSGRRHLARYVQDHGLILSSFTADIPGLRLTDPRAVDERIERTCQIIDLARELKVPIVTSAVGALTHPQSGEPSSLAVSALQRIAEHADSRSVIYAMRPSYDNHERLRRVLDALRCPAIRIGLDPAALIMSGASPTAIAEQLAAEIALVHARDATAGLTDRPGIETRFGEGEVDFATIHQLLCDAEYAGPVIARRLDAQNPIADLADARQRLAKLT